MEPRKWLTTCLVSLFTRIDNIRLLQTTKKVKGVIVHLYVKSRHREKTHRL